ncbi:CPSF A subunit region-domain-containing protein [Suillus subalutaceus]|uniref:CPSF A subunit region-domain-containing protein n=1 Tax=Suillus subalutaceus TaxID=48586 RepID=UPI001B86D7D7|nr:CPSF A subunit region-domain-containing protein [Suillus subalutaceus]KAG1848301.1 CPSF A subunit region-domain-containing protein [Suillus subalutaceus]
MHALRHDILPPSGVEFATTLKLTPSTITGSSSQEKLPRVLTNVVVSRSNLLRIFEVWEQPPQISTYIEDERERRAHVRKGTEAVEGEVEMDEGGEGWVNMGSVKAAAKKDPSMVSRFHFVREHTLHGTVTGMESVRIMSTYEDQLDRLLVSFKDAKIALLEWSDAAHDLVTVSIHTYERAPQMVSLDSPLFKTELRADPLSRCAALSLPKDAFAILPFFQTQAELDTMEQEQNHTRDVPYSPSFVLDLVNDVDERIRNVIDFVFLPGYNNPTVAVLCQSEQTWAGRLKEYRDTARLYIFTLDLMSRNYPIITAVDGLPYDSVSLIPCATSLGGVIVLTSNSIIYVDQAARRVGLPVNGWAARVSDMPMPPADKDLGLCLEGSRLVFVDEKTFFVIRKDGMIHPIEIILDGRTVSKLVLLPVIAQTTIPAVAKLLNDDLLFVGSMVGPSVLMKTAREEVPLELPAQQTGAATTIDFADSMDLDDDDDLYGDSQTAAQATVGATSGTSAATKTRSVIHLSLCDSLPAYGPIADMTFSLAKNGERFVPELVAATGAGHLGGFTLFQRDLPTRTKRKLHVLGGARGIWSLSVRQSQRVNGLSYEKATGPFSAEIDTIIISTDANPTPGVSRIATRTTKTDVSIPTRIPGTTISAAPFFQRTTILHVMTNAIRVLEPDGNERQVIKDMDGSLPRAKIKSCSICDPFVLILREDESIGLFIGETERGKIRRKDMSPMGDKSSRYIAGCFFTDTIGLFDIEATETTPAAAHADKNTSTLQAAVAAGNRSQWLVLVRPQGVMEIWSLPKLTLVFSTTAISTLENILVDVRAPAALSLPQDPPRKPQDLDIDQILVAPLGETSLVPHLFVFTRSGNMAIYEALPAPTSTEQADPLLPNPRTAFLKVKFHKVVSKTFEIQRVEETERTVLAEHKRISRTFVPFVTSPNMECTLAGVFFTGDRPCWIIATDKGGLRVVPSGHTVVHAFTACSLWESKGDFLLYSDEGPTLLEWAPEVQLDSCLPYRSVPRSRAYSNIVFEPSASLIVAASSLQARFASYDEDGNIIWEPDGNGVSFPCADCSTLELISPEHWVTMDGYEFASNETINALTCVSLETTSTESGTKNFIAVGTTVNRGEDLAVKGATYIFEAVEVVSDPNWTPKRWYKLKLRVKDDTKGPVTAVCGINGYLVSSMGQKIFIRALDLDERLVGVAFLDVGVYVTSLRSMKNLLLIGDAVKSVWLVAFQEDPYKLVTLAKDVRRRHATTVDFFFAGGDLAIASEDEEGVLRLFAYDPSDPESRGGQHLLCHTEFHSHKECRSTITIARRTKDEQLIPQAKLMSGFTDGSLSALTPVDEAVFKRLQLMQGQLTRNMQHTAGLNPKAHRIVRNDAVSKPLSKSVLDGQLLSEFQVLGISRQNEITRQIGTERALVLHDWSSLVVPW